MLAGLPCIDAYSCSTHLRFDTHLTACLGAATSPGEKVYIYKSTMQASKDIWLVAPIYAPKDLSGNMPSPGRIVYIFRTSTLSLLEVGGRGKEACIVGCEVYAELFHLVSDRRLYTIHAIYQVRIYFCIHTSSYGRRRGLVSHNRICQIISLINERVLTKYLTA